MKSSRRWASRHDASDDDDHRGRQEGVRQHDAAAAQAALQAALSPIATALGLGADADGAAIVAGIARLKAGQARQRSRHRPAGRARRRHQPAQRVRDGIARKDAEAFVDGAIAEGRVGVKPMRDEYIAMHMEDPERVKKLIGAMPSIKGGAIRERTEPSAPPSSTTRTAA
jgi:hypothetical protein